MPQVITEEICDQNIQLWSDALAALAEGRSFQVGDRIIAFDSSAEARQNLDYWVSRKNKLVRASSGLRSFRGVSGTAVFK